MSLLGVERKLGERFTCDDVLLCTVIDEEDSCFGCYFDDAPTCPLHCAHSERIDSKSVKFVVATDMTLETPKEIIFDYVNPLKEIYVNLRSSYFSRDTATFNDALDKLGNLIDKLSH